MLPQGTWDSSRTEAENSVFLLSCSWELGVPLKLKQVSWASS